MHECLAHCGASTGKTEQQHMNSLHNTMSWLFLSHPQDRWTMGVELLFQLLLLTPAVMLLRPLPTCSSEVLLLPYFTHGSGAPVGILVQACFERSCCAVMPPMPICVTPVRKQVSNTPLHACEGDYGVSGEDSDALLHKGASYVDCPVRSGQADKPGSMLFPCRCVVEDSTSRWDGSKAPQGLVASTHDMPCSMQEHTRQPGLLSRTKSSN